MPVMAGPTMISPSKFSRRSTPKGRMYDIETVAGDIHSLPSVTTRLSVIGKPALIHWAANTSRAEAIDVAANLYTTVAGNPPMSKTAFVTTMKKWLGEERADQKQLARAGEIGNQVHKQVEWTLRHELGQKVGPQPELSIEGQNAFAAWVVWRQQVNLKPIHIEQVVYSLEFEYAGTLDLYAEVDGKLSILDWKSGKAIYPEAYLQNAAYRYAFREMNHGRVEQGLIVRLPKTKTDDPKPEVKVINDEDYRKDLEMFLKVSRLWDYLNDFNR